MNTQDQTLTKKGPEGQYCDENTLAVVQLLVVLNPVEKLCLM